ncbi:MAG: glycoside hydrolase family 2 TIM barrel-domain containing protein [Oscillospiraceae bacterium]
MNLCETYTNRTLFCNGWEFCKAAFGSDYSDSFDFKAVDLPHDWLIYNTNDLYETSTGWYRKSFYYAKKEGIRTYIRFDGVYMDSSVYVNGEKAGEWKYGYSAFMFDITDMIKDGENIITVRVDHHAPNSRWYSGAGIYRKVWLCESPEIRFGNDGIYISTAQHGNLWKVSVTSEILRPENTPVAGIRLKNTILDISGCIVSSCESDVCAADISCIPRAVRVGGAAYSLTTQIMNVDSPQLWDIDEPYLYTMVSEIIVNNDIIQRISQKFGFRTIEFTADHGFFLNGRNIKLHGSCEHHDNGCLGAVSNIAALRRRFKKLREMGVNAIRTSHNMPAEELMELADETGMLILSEGFDMWERSKTDYDYARFFDEWAEKDVASWIRRDRNHPSIIGWSIGNEIFDTHADERGQEVTSMLKRLVMLHDPNGNGYVTFGSNYMQWENGQKCGDILKLVGYNYGERLYHEHHKAHPDWMIYGSETASVVQSRGIYHFPLSKTVLADDDEQCSSLGNSCTGWGAKNTEECIIKDRDAQFCAGQFIWTGFDYIGEPTPYSTKNSYFGQYDTAGFPKDSAYVFRAEWTDYKKSPFVHIFPYWDFNEGMPIDVRVCSNAPRVELFFNGISMGAFDIDHLHGNKLTADYIIPYEKVELKAVAYDENGNIIAEDIQRSFGDAARLEISADKTEIKADGSDLIYLEISAVDENGTFCANANNRVNVSVEGAGRLMGLDNGDSTDYDQYKGTSRRLFSGKMLAVIGSSDVTGDIKVTLTSPCLPDSVITLKAVSGEYISGTASSENVTFAETECGRADEIPVRKIELCAKHLIFSENMREMTVTSKVYPAGSDYANEIEYKVTNETGIPTNLAVCTDNADGTVTLKALGDGSFYLRALCKNGTERYHIMSVLKFTAEGLGNALTDPYSYVSGGLYTRASDNICSGIGKGVGFAMGKVSSWAAYDNVDFGASGSDTVTVYVWANTLDPVDIRFYDGIPNEGGKLLGSYEYHKQPEWMVFKEETYKLPTRLKGIRTFCIETDCGFQLSGFEFTKASREFSVNYAAEAEHIYGDKFAVEEKAVTGIGNNVMLDFGEFDFTSEQPRRIIISGKSPLPLNSIHLILNGNDGEKRILCEFNTDTDTEYSGRIFDVTDINGKQTVSFAFLPGSNFDFEYFRFEK